MRKVLLLTSAFLLLAHSSACAAIIASDGTQASVIAKITLASAGDTVTIPASGGPFTWGASGTGIALNKAIHLTNLGSTILMSSTGPTFGSGVISMSGNGGWLDGTWTITGALNGSTAVTPIAVAGTNFVITGITYNAPNTNGGYFVYVSDATGVCYGCTINDTFGTGTLQTFQQRGNDSRWNVANTMGTSNAFYVEDCTINSAYAQEGDGCAASVIRFCTLQAGATLDMHMIETSTSTSGTPHGSRQFEGYDNTYTGTGDPQWVRAQGGTAMIFDNVVPQQAGSGGSTHFYALILEYGAQTGIYQNQSTGILPRVPTPSQYPIPDQIGIGPYVTGVQTGGAEPLYYWNNQETDGTDNPLLGLNPQSAAAIAAQGATFYATSEDGSPYMLGRHRDYFRGVTGGAFPSVSDVGRGTFAAMNASSPTLAGQAWWVTDRGSWNTKLAANTSGCLYRWSGSAWVLFYTPYTYPHPLRNATTTASNGGMSGNAQIKGNASLQ